ncbi:MAG: acyl-CoA dehydrogenase family protein [Acidobacteria bacterium]|nr:acyl-CoA dehydrogenase family protein [Acidobacteriota bacterium]
MDFGLTEEQLQIKKAVREFALGEIAPHVTTYDEEERFPVEIIKKAAQQGYMGGVVPVEYGGAGLDYTTYTLIIEEISRVCQVVGCALSFPSGLAGSAVLRYGTDEQKRKYLMPLAKGEAFAATGVTEPGSGTDVAAMRTTCRRDGKYYVLNGTKAWISFLDVCDWVLTFATLDRSLKHKSICAFIIDRNTPGMTFKPYKHKLGFRPICTGEVVLEDCRVPVENMIGKEGEGFKVAMCAVENGRLGVAARAVGMAQTCLDEAVKYAQERIVFDQPIGKFQLVQSMITDMVVGIESARYLTYRLAWLKDQGVEHARKEASVAKMVATDVALMAATNAVQIFGAYGCSGEYPVSRYFRDAKVFQIVEGQNQLHKAIIAEYTLGYRTR